jgi:predicted aspartyl protease
MTPKDADAKAAGRRLINSMAPEIHVQMRRMRVPKGDDIAIGPSLPGNEHALRRRLRGGLAAACPQPRSPDVAQSGWAAGGLPDQAGALIAGLVNARHEAIVRLRLRGPGRLEADLESLIDTGITGSLALPTTTAAALGLARQSGGSAILADGSVRQFDVYAAEVQWKRGWRPVLVSAVGDEALLGMRLVAGNELRIAVVPGGVVAITPLPSPRP